MRLPALALLLAMALSGCPGGDGGGYVGDGPGVGGGADGTGDGPGVDGSDDAGREGTHRDGTGGGTTGRGVDAVRA